MSRGDRGIGGGIPEIDPGPLYDENEHYLLDEAPGEDVTDADLRADAYNPEGWLHYNKGLENHGFSPASRLRPETMDAFEQVYEVSFASTMYQCNPTVVPGDPPVIYVGLGDMSVLAINARTGDKYWKFGYALENTGGVSGRTRGIAVRGDKAYLAATDLRIVALNRYTGAFQWKTHALSERQAEIMSRPEKMGQSQGPIAYDGTVMVGQSGGFGCWGAVTGIDAETGDLQWDHDICRPENWVGKSWQYGDGASWVNPAIDPVTGYVFHATGNPGVRYNGTVRPGPNRDADSVIAIDIETGEHVWSYQLLAQDWFDWDCSTTPRIFDLTVDGDQRRALAVEDKSGWSHVLDAETGQLIERTEAYAKQGGDGAEDLEFLSIPGVGQENAKYMWPDDQGGTNWSPDAFSPRTGLLYIGGNDMAQKFYWTPGFEFDPDNMSIVPGGGRGQFADTRNCRVAAIDPADGGRVKWTHEFERARGNRVQAGGMTATAGGLLFAGSSARKVVALEDDSGEKIWEDDLGATVESSPVVWDDPIEERQYVAVSYDVDADGSRTGKGRLRVYATEPGLDALETPTPAPTASPTASSTASPTGGHSPTLTNAERESESETSTPSAPGFGVGAALAGTGLAAFRRLVGSDEDADGE